MKVLSEKSALIRLSRLKAGLRDDLAIYEQRAKSCENCDTPGACCLDAHFVNVRISRIEAVAMKAVIDHLPPIRRAAVEHRIADAAAGLNSGGRTNATFACPLYEKRTGCLVHDDAKPVPCMIHACYERREDLPPDQLQDNAELVIDRLNARVYGRTLPLEPIPFALQAILRTRKSQDITSPARNQPAT